MIHQRHSRTDRLTDRQTTCDRKTALCAVKTDHVACTINWSLTVPQNLVPQVISHNRDVIFRLCISSVCWRVQRERAMGMLAEKWDCTSEEEKAPHYQKACEVKEAYFNKVRSLYIVLLVYHIIKRVGKRRERMWRNCPLENFYTGTRICICERYF